MQSQSRLNFQFLKDICKDGNAHINLDVSITKKDVSISLPYYSPTAIVVDYKKVEDAFREVGYYNKNTGEFEPLPIEEGSLYDPDQHKKIDKVDTSIFETNNKRYVITEDNAIISGNGNVITMPENFEDDRFFVINSNNVTINDVNININVPVDDTSVSMIGVYVKNPEDSSTIATATLKNVNITSPNPVIGCDNTVITIKSGTITCNTTAEAVKSQGGLIKIEGGTYKSDDYNGKNYCLNVIDNRFKDGKTPLDFFQVTGGTFIGFDPANAYTEPEPFSPCSFVPEGYQSIETEPGVFTVSKIEN